MKKTYYIYYSVLTILIGILITMLIVAGAQWISKSFAHKVTTFPVKNIDTNAEAVAEENAGVTGASQENLESLTPAVSLLTGAKGTTPITAPEYIVETLGGISPHTNAFVAGNSVIDQKDADRSVPIASLTKLVTAVMADNLIDRTTIINIGPRVLATYSGNTAKLVDGEQISAHDLLYPLLMTSSNDAAEALALTYGKKAFVKAMNDWVYSIGAYHTYFAEPTGLSSENISSATDIFTILNWIYINRPDLIAITTTKVKTVGFHTWVNPAHLLNLTAYIGGKDGYTPEAGLTAATLFAITTDGKHQIVAIIVLGSKNRDRDVLGLIDRIGTNVMTLNK